MKSMTITFLANHYSDNPHPTILLLYPHYGRKNVTVGAQQQGDQVVGQHLKK